MAWHASNLKKNNSKEKKQWLEALLDQTRFRLFECVTFCDVVTFVTEMFESSALSLSRGLY